MTDGELVRALFLLGLSAGDLLAIRKGEAALTKLREKAKKRYRKAAHRLHPDKTGGDEAKAADFRLLNDFMRELDRMALPRPPIRQRRRTGVLKVHFTVRMPSSR